ncbi:MAG: hypothetical protein R3E13_09460 [Alphaproteobacteria bacterium]
MGGIRKNFEQRRQKRIAKHKKARKKVLPSKHRYDDGVTLPSGFFQQWYETAGAGGVHETAQNPTQAFVDAVANSLKNTHGTGTQHRRASGPPILTITPGGKA